jgi:RNA polymerase sigma-70 factor (ECF subfamily)
VGTATRRRDEAGDDADLARWVAAARGGDIDAFGCLWQALAGRVHGYVRARGVANPDDVTSEVFLAAFTSIARFDGGPAQFRSWLFTIAHHKAVDEHRRRRDDAEYDAAVDPRVVASAEAAALDGIIEGDVKAMLESLTSEQREVLLLRALGDLSVEQVADVTGRSVGAVKQLHHRAVATAQRAAAAQRRPGWLPRPRRDRLSLPDADTAVTTTAPHAMTET